MSREFLERPQQHVKLYQKEQKKEIHQRFACIETFAKGLILPVFDLGFLSHPILEVETS